jgi:hypothetical protein
MRTARLAALGFAFVACSGSSGPADSGPLTSFAANAAAAQGAMLEDFYDGQGEWNACVPSGACFTDNFDWGADSMTNALYLRWEGTHDPAIATVMGALNATALTWPPCSLPDCIALSDVPSWDSIASSREYAVTQDAGALARAEANFAVVDQSNAFALGACPGIDYQQAGAGDGGNILKTLETDSNYVKAALLLYEETGTPSYLQKAETKYQAVRQYFLDPTVPLYTVFVFDDGGVCWQAPRKFFASVNGNLIWAGLHLARDTGQATYQDQAWATATAVTQDLGDGTGVFADMEDEDDVEAPLVEGMLELSGDAGFARAWILANAAAAQASRTPQGVYGRYFDGPPPETVTEWQSNGSFALAFAAALVAPDGGFAPDPFWSGATYVDAGYADPPFSISFTGRGVALVGTLGAVCCYLGHAQVLVDGVQTFNETGIVQNESPPSVSLPDSILFAWRWPDAGAHTLQFEPGPYDPKEGGSFLQLSGYEVVP